ncbi:dihydroorotate dehydrogenase electron transfer subunit [Halonatronum saccharophilum]|uniref:dihydroorotate dehydrogenase electron transfer subunit n=1 Tax=Halonatronum saccharophilum TaxID=150060 RepID=UPI0004872F4D|nr:dihydroorotate dehydrogenase electron transfer subunit [Halonatronum saccharophilum]
MSQRVIKEILSQEEIAPKHFKMVIDAPEIVEGAKPGQFLHLKWVDNIGGDPLLRRPISINDMDKDSGELSIIYRVLGRGTELLSRLSKGDKVDIMGPIGKGFSIPKEARKVVVVGGGMGIAPLYPIVKELLNKDREITLFLGGADEGQLLNLKDYEEMDLELKTSTVDGSHGYKGFVTDLLEEALDGADYIYTCGPEGMMEVVQEKAKKLGVKGEASLEERMGCGTGACLSCVCKIKVGTKDDWEYKKTCTQGPIFPVEEVIFNG